MPNLIGQSLGRYHILEQLGEGGMAVVYKALDTRLERNVAIKVILPGKEHSDKFLKRFEREAKALASLSHPNIVKVIDYGEHEGLPFLVMEYIPSGTLKHRLGKPIAWQEAARTLIPIARALAYAHENKIIHRDVKPANILITQSGEPMLSDFGIAKMLETEETLDLTGTGVGVGTPEYMSPEQAQGKALDGRSDLYSLGVVLYEMVTGRKPYQADTPMAVVYKLASEPLPRPKQFVPEMTDQVEAALLKMLAKSPEHRFENMGQFIKFIEKLPDANQPVRQKRNQPVVWMKLGMIALAAVGIFGLGGFLTTLVAGNNPLQETQQPTSITESALPTHTPEILDQSSTNTYTYLKDMTPIEAWAQEDYLGFGVFPWSEGPMTEGRTIFVQGRSYPEAIFAHATSNLKYEIGGKYNILEAQAYYFGPCNPAGDEAVFRIYGDYQLLYTSPHLNYGDAPDPVRVSISGVKELLLSTDSLEDYSCDWTIWLDPRLIP